MLNKLEIKLSQLYVNVYNTFYKLHSAHIIKNV